MQLTASLCAWLGLLVLGGLVPRPAGAQTFGNNIRFQNGSSPVVNGSRFEILSSSGQKAGGNLFHSFSDFSVGKGSSAVFKTPSDVRNIVARVTGPSASAIDGTLRTEWENSGAMSDANLYLVNPNGILFGPDARLEVGGAFTATTADYLKLSDGGRVDARTPANDVLTSAPVSAFGFLGPNAPAAVKFSGSSLAAAPRTGLKVIAGSVSLTGANLQAPSGELLLHATRGGGEVAASEMPGALPPAPSTLGPVELHGQSLAGIDGTEGGALKVRASTLTLDGGSSITSANSGAVTGGALDIWSGTVQLLGGSRIESSTLGEGPGGAVYVRATDGIFVDGDDGVRASAIRSTTQGAATGTGGPVQIKTDGLVELTQGGSIASLAQSAGNAGSLTVEAGAIHIAGRTSHGAPGIVNQADSSTGDAGALSVTAQREIRIDDGVISNATFTSGRGGQLTLRADSLEIIGTNNGENFPGVSVQSNRNATGRGGNLDVDVHGAITLSNGGLISASAFSAGDAGSMAIHAGSMTIDGRGTPNAVTGVLARALPDSTGAAGNVRLTLDGALTIYGRGSVATTTDSPGRGGDLGLHAASLLIDGGGLPADVYTGISSGSNGGGPGDAGNLAIEINGPASLLAGGQISSTTFSAGRAGDLSFRAGSLLIDGAAAAPRAYTGLGSQSAAEAHGNAGNIAIDIPGALTLLGGAEISANTFSSGTGGNLTVRAGSITLDGSATSQVFTAIITAAEEGSTGQAGALSLEVAGALTVKSAAQISSSTNGTGQGGALTVRAGSLAIGGTLPEYVSRITARSQSAATGDAGHLRLDIAGLVSLTNGGVISTETSSPGRGGNLMLQAGALMVDGSATPLFSTGIVSQSKFNASGDAGNLSINVTGAVQVLSGGLISTSTSSPGQGGDLTLNAGSLLLARLGNSARFTGITTQTNGGATGRAGNLTAHIAGAAVIKGGEISVATFSSGRGGNLTLSADSLLIDGSAHPGQFTGISANSGTAGAARAGNLNLDIARAVTLLAGGEISARTVSDSDAGNLRLHAASLTIDGSRDLQYVTGILAQAGTDDAPWLTGSAGRVIIDVDGPIAMLGGGKILSSAVSKGDGGDVSLRAANLTLDGRGNSEILTEISASAIDGDAGRVAIALTKGLRVIHGAEIFAGTEGAGRGGSLAIRAGSVFVGQDGLIAADTYGSGRGGALRIDTPRLTVDGAGASFFTGLSSDSFYGGDAGGVIIHAGIIDLRHGGQITADTHRGGNAGNISVTADALIIGRHSSSSDEYEDGIFATALKGATGRAGNIFVNAGSLVMENGGRVSAVTQSSGTGGNVTLGIQDATLASGAGISAAATSTGAGGSIFASFGRLRLSDGAFISTTASGALPAGRISLEVAGSVSLVGGSSIGSAAVQSPAGSIDLHAGSDISLVDSSITVQSARSDAGTIRLISPGRLSLVRSNLTAEAGRDGGNLKLALGELVLREGSRIVANAVAGNGGRISLQIPAAGFFGDASDFVIASPFVSQSSDSRISASSELGLPGVLQIGAPFVDLAGNLKPLDFSFPDATSELREHCARKLKGDFSSYLRQGSGGIQAQPNEPGPTF